MKELNNNRRLLELDALRGLAALAVVFFHYTTRYDQLFGHEKLNYIDFSYGHYGVNLFFMISGFVIFMTLKRIGNVKEFISKRALRLYPAYIIAVVITYICVKLYGLEGREVSLSQAIVNLTMFQGHVGIPHVDGAYWSLTVELTFYIIIGFLIYFGLTKSIQNISIIWLLISSCIMISGIVMNSFLFEIITYLSISRYSHLFVAGIMFYLIRINPSVKSYIILLGCLLYDYIFMSFESNIFITISFIIFYLIINNKLQFLSIRPLVFLGTISYSFYLVHQNIGYIIINLLERNGFTHELYLLVPILFSILLATLLTFYIEKPIQKYVRNKSKEKYKTPVDTREAIK